MKYYLYILKSQKDNKHYIGIAKNIKDRLSQHNSGKVQSTKHRKPFILIYKELFQTRLEARTREKYLKSYSGVSEKRKIIDEYGIGE